MMRSYWVIVDRAGDVWDEPLPLRDEAEQNASHYTVKFPHYAPFRVIEYVPKESQE